MLNMMLLLLLYVFVVVLAAVVVFLELEMWPQQRAVQQPQTKQSTLILHLHKVQGNNSTN